MPAALTESFIRIFLFSALFFFVSSSLADTIEVTERDDARLEQMPVSGSLRDVIANQAEPGDTIIFNVKGPIALRDDLVIPSNLPGITIQGPVEIRPVRGQAAVISVEADGVTITGMTFANVSIVASDARGGVPRRIQGFTLAGNNFQGDAQVAISHVDNCSVINNPMNVRPRTGRDDALTTQETHNCLITRNEIHAAKDSAYRDFDSTDLKLIDNPFKKGDVWISSISGEIRGNNLNGRMHVWFPDIGTSNGLLLVENNEAHSITAIRTYISLIENTLSGRSRYRGSQLPALFLSNEDPHGPQGPVRIEKNIITGGLNGITYAEEPTAAPAIIHDNDISGCNVRGILVNRGRDVRVTQNDIRVCGSDALGRGIAVGRAAATGVVLEENVISQIDGTGILVVAQLDGIDVLLRNNTVTTSKAAGISLPSNDFNENGRIRMEGNILSENEIAGVLAEENTRGVIVGGAITNNAGDGVSIQSGAEIEIRNVRMGGNVGAGIDIDPDGITSNADTKIGNGDLDWPENVSINPVTLKLEGSAAPGSIVELFVVESGDRLGNPDNGEGTDFLGAATAGPDGSFVFPEAGTIQCPATRLITLTATLEGDSAVTSEFSPDFDCVIPDVVPEDDDEDGVVNGVDECPATPAGEAVDAGGCAESQKDDDDDGVVNSEDRCPDAGDPAYSGCAGEVAIPGLGTAYLNDLGTSTISTGAPGESCNDCSIEFDDSTGHFCFGPGGLVIVSATEIQSNSCGYEAPALSIDGTGAVITSILNEFVACEGDANQCQVDAANDDLDGVCTEVSCVKYFSNSLINGESFDPTKVAVSKSTLGGDGHFVLLGRTGVEYPYFWGVNTSAGLGNKIAELHFGSEGALIIEEEPQVEWLESVLCTNNVSGESLAGENQLALHSVPSETFTTWQCEFLNSAISDSDDDGVPDDVDRCSNPGTGGNECPEQGDNGSVAHYCNVELNCSFDQTEGYCNDCWIERLDGSGSIYCPPGGVCALRNSTDLRCEAGNCEYFTRNLSGSCAAGSVCTLDSGFSCQSDQNGNGCDGTFAWGEALSCPAQACDIIISPNVIHENSPQSVTVDFRKETQGGDGIFTFGWRINNTFVDPYFDVGEFTIETQSLVGQRAARLYIDPNNNSVTVTEQQNDPFVLDRIDCITDVGITLTPTIDLPPDIAGEITVGDENSCTFVNIKPAAQPDRVETIPDNHLFPDGVNNIAPNVFGGQLNTTNPVVGIGTGSSEIFVDVVTGDVPRAGNDRLSFSGSGFPSFGALVQPNEDFPGYDTVRSSGPGTISYQFDPNNGFFGSGVLGFDTIIDLLHLGNDNTASALLSVNRTRNTINVMSPPVSTGVSDFFGPFEVIKSQNLQDATGLVVSAQAYDLGRLDCFNPCEGSGSQMPSGCSTEIELVLASPGFDYCADAWTPSCATEYSNQNDNFCSLPAVDRQVNFGGSVLVLTDGAPGQIHMANPALDFFGRVETIANVGNDPKRVRCLAGVCAITNNGSDSLTILTWDGAGAAAVTATVTVGDGPIGLDLRQIGNEIVILSTGSNDNTYTVTTVSLTGQLLDNVTKNMLAGCDTPGHITWVDGSSKAFATCFNSHSYAVFEP